MSGFVAILDTTGAPIDQRLVRTIIDVPPYDAGHAEVWTDEGVALGRASFRTPHRLETWQLPARASRLRIVMEGRLDDRAALIRELHRDLDSASDVELVCAAYERWGGSCPSRLLGDFSFCLWDPERRQLLCARDHFGVKPLYYARVGGAIVISNVLRSVRRYPGVSERLDDLAVGDVLLFGLAMDPSRTMFSGVSRVPPAHALVCSGTGALDVRRYWEFTPPPPHDYLDEGEAVEEFAAVLRQAVADRVRGGRIAVLMSGGLDSSSIASVAASVLGPSASESMRAVTGVYETVAEDEERHYSSLVAARLNIRIDHVPLDRYELFDGWGNGGLPPEPTTEPLTAATGDLLARAAEHSAVVLAGDGGDPLLLPSTLLDQLRNVPFRRLMAGFWTAVRAQALPPIGLRPLLRRRLRSEANPVPTWLADPLLRSFDAHARWAEISAQRSADRGPRSGAVNSLIDPWWPSTFETYHPGATGRPVEIRYPYFDLRLVGIALRLPSFPFCVNKHVLRRAMRQHLPDAVVRRPKTPLAVMPEAFHGRWSLPASVQTLAAVPAMQQYVNVPKFAAAVRPEFMFTDRARGSLAAVSLAMWLKHSTAAVSLC